MTAGSDPATASVDAALARAATHGASLHHLAAMLTGSTGRATALTARVLLAADASTTTAQLQADLVRVYLRTAPRRPQHLERLERLERLGTGLPLDAGDVLPTLRPRARATAALRLVLGWGPAAVAPAVGVRQQRVDALVPSTPGLADALATVADQHALTGPELDRELADRVRCATPPSTTRSRRRRTWLVAAAVPVGIFVGWAVGSDGPVDAPDPSVVTAAPDGDPVTDLTTAGWALTEQGGPPTGAMGLSLASAVSVDAGDLRTEVSWGTPLNGWASFAVLWCDMPPAQDPNITVPTGTLTMGTADVDLRCAGTDGSPPVTEVVALPPGGTGTLEVAGDLPPDGGATLAVYHETDSPSAPLPRGSLAVPGPTRAEGVVLEPGGPVPATDLGRDHQVWGAAAVDVGHDSAVRVWAGRTGAVAVNVDGVPVTDDGDAAGVTAWLTSGGGPGDSTGPSIDWRSQRPDLRWGRWLVWVPGEVRTFELPAASRPAPGERATVSVEVVTQSSAEHVQVVVLDAAAAEVDTGPVPALTDLQAPSFVLGHRLVGAWTLPQDGQRRELLGAEDLDDELVPLGTWSRERPFSLFLGTGYVERDGQVRGVPYAPSVAAAVEAALGTGGLSAGPRTILPSGDGTLTASAPAAPGQPDSLLLLYTPVPYEEYDFASGSPPPGSWRADEEPPPDGEFLGAEAVVVVGPEDLQDGRARVELQHEGSLAARITTEGKGRMRFGIGRDGHQWPAGDGDWWSSWTAEPVTSEVSISYPGAWPPADLLTLEVEGYEDFAVEVLTPDR